MAADQGVKKLPLRNEIAEKDTWRLEDIFPSDDAWEREFQEVKTMIPGIKKFQGRLGESAATLYEALQFQDQLLERLGKLHAYSHMRYDQDTTNSFYQALDDRMRNLYAQAASQLSFIVPELLSIAEEKLNAFLAEKEELQLYEHALAEINRQRPHVLSAEQEVILAEASEVMSASHNTFSMLNNADLEFPAIKNEKGEEVQLTHGRFISFLESADRRVRHDAFKAMYDSYGKFRNTFASTLSGNVKKNNFYARIRKYSSAREAALAKNNIPESVYDNLISTVTEHLPLLHRYIKLRKEILGLSELHMYDLYTPLVKDVKIEITYDEAKDIILAGLSPLGEDYLNVVKEGFANRWIDVYENKGKRSGAYSSGAYGTNPYILLNWQNNINDLFTLAHELGHSVHSYYTRKYQPFVYGNYSIFVAEVASTCNEALLNEYLLRSFDDEKKRMYLLNHYLESFRATVFRQTMFAEFEHYIHQKHNMVRL